MNTDVTSYDVLQLRLRGDGRTYVVSLQPPGFNTGDMYQAFVYTKGGPFWEEITVSRLRCFVILARDLGEKFALEVCDY